MSIRRGRLRSTIKWGGAVLTVLLLIVWVWCAKRVAVVYQSPRAQVQLLSGRLKVAWETIPVRFRKSRGLFPFPSGPIGLPFEWWFTIKTTRGNVMGATMTIVAIPIWSLALLSGVPTIVLVLRDRRPKANTCLKCGYSRTGLPADRACPECGAASHGHGGAGAAAK